ncbi:MAG: tetratricopeptide repeat protein [Microcystis panniformis]
MKKRLNNPQYLGKNLAKYLNRAIALLGFTAVLFAPIELSQARVFAEVERAIVRLLVQNNTDFSTFFSSAQEKYEKGDFQGAIADYSRAIELNPNDYHSYMMRGVIRGNLGDRQGAIADYTKAIEINPTMPYAYINRGAERFFLGDIQGAISDYNQAIKIDPNEAPNYSNRGQARQNLGDFSGAIADWQKAAELYRQQGNLEASQDELKKIQSLQQR